MDSFFKLVTRPGRRMRKLVDIAMTARRVRGVFSGEYLTVFQRARRLHKRESFRLEEAYQQGLLSPEMSERDVWAYVSKKNMTRVQRTLNPESWEAVAMNKAILHRFLTAGGIASPALYAVFVRDMAGWTCDGRCPKTVEQWCEYIERDLPDAFFVKPAEGALGEGVRMYSRRRGGFVDFGGGEHTSREIYDAMYSDREYDSYVIQERLENHPEIVKLTGQENLQTIRFISLVDSKGRSRLLRAQIKLICGDNLTDNFEQGVTGNMQSEVRLDSGGLRPAIACEPNDGRIRCVTNHPQTGIRFEDFTIPYWTEACQLVLRSARLVLPIRTVGWDIAITPDGPMVLEGNIWWNPPNRHKGMDRLLDTLSSDSPMA